MMEPETEAPGNSGQSMPQSFNVRIPFEPSGIFVHEQGIFIADDELVGSLWFLPREAIDGGADPLLSLAKLEWGKPKSPKQKYIGTEDIEGMGVDAKGRMIALGSHEPKKDLTRRVTREFLLRVKIYIEKNDGEYEIELRAKKHPMASSIFDRLDGKLPFPLKDTKKKLKARINLEGVAEIEKTLYLGLRAPLTEDNKALLCALPRDGEAAVHALDLEGGGVRDLLAESPDSLLVLSGYDRGKGRPAIWRVRLDSWAPEKVYTFTDDDLRAGEGGAGAPEGIALWHDGRLLAAVEHEPTRHGHLLLIGLPSGAMVTD